LEGLASFLARQLRMALEEVVEAGMIMLPAPGSVRRTPGLENTSWAILLERESSAKLRWDGNRKVACRSVALDPSHQYI
jgi:hypothetical protein